MSIRAKIKLKLQVGPKNGPFTKKCITYVYGDVERRSIYKKNVQLFIRIKNGIFEYRHI